MLGMETERRMFMKAKFFFVGSPGSDCRKDEVEEQLNEFLKSVKVVQILQSSVPYSGFGFNSLSVSRIETLITVLYEPKKAKKTLDLDCVYDA